MFCTALLLFIIVMSYHLKNIHKHYIFMNGIYYPVFSC